MILDEVLLWPRSLSVTHTGIARGLKPSLHLKGCILASLFTVARRVSYAGVKDCEHVGKLSLFLIFYIMAAIHYLF